MNVSSRTAPAPSLHCSYGSNERISPAALFVALATCAALLAVGGCSKGDSKIVPIRGRLLFKGQPIPQVYLRFEPDDLTTKATSMAITDASGKFEMAMGSTPGVYRGLVTIFCDDPLAAMGAKTPVPKDIEAAYRELCAKYGAGKSNYQLTIDKPNSNLELKLD